MSLLSFVLFLPLIGFFLLLRLPKDSRAPFYVSLGAALVTFFTSLGLIGPALVDGARFSSVVDSIWITSPNLEIRWHLGVDGFSLWLILLVTLLVPIGIWFSDTMITDRKKSFFALVLLFEFGIIGVFSALDLFVFYVFWEVALIPMYLLVGTWGGRRRMYAAVKFFVYTFAGSVLMLGTIIYLHTQTGTFDYVAIVSALQSGRVTLSSSTQLILFLGFFAAFAVKVPIFPFHTWLPVTYGEAPTAVTFLLAALMSKMGTYGLVRYCLVLTPSAAHRCASWIAVLAIIGIIYGALLALVQTDVKRLIAYSSVSHLGFIVLGIFTFTQQGIDGAVFQMVAHGISIGALFLLVGYIEQRRGTLEISELGGLANGAPRLAAFFMITMFASIGLPALCNFVGEFLVLQGAALAHFAWAAWAAIGVILSAAYMLWMYQRVFLGHLNERHGPMLDLVGRDWVALVPLVLLMVWLGVYTQSFMPVISAATSRTLDQSKINEEYRVKLTTPQPVQTAEVYHAR
jgi:NADH-quinone oxidoreductase subunit M